jgi:regulator of replication initiation timing
MADRLFDAESLSEVQIQVEDMRRKELKLVDENRNLQIEINSLNRYISKMMYIIKRNYEIRI